MSKLVAIEWDSAELRIVVGRARGTEVVVEQAATAELPRKEEEVDVGPHLASLLTQLQVGRSEVLIGIGRTNIELRKLQLPPSPDEELPDMVRFQAMRQFTTIGEDWPLDYVPLQHNESGVEVLAAALSPNIVQQIRATCATLELTPKCLVLRPFAAASLMMRANPNESRCCLVVDVLATEADLFVLAEGNVAFLRTVRLPDAQHGSTALVSALVGEVRRTIGAAQSQMGGRRIEAIVVFADQDRYAELRATMGSQLTLPVETINPFTAVKVGGDLERRLPDEPGRYAPLLGMMLDEAAETGHRIDFLHPRKRPAPKSSRTKYLAITAAAAAVVCLFAFALKWQLDRKDAEIAKLRSHVDSMKPNVDAAAKQSSHLNEVENFMSGNTPWLPGLARLSERLPPAKDALITSFKGSVQQDGSARVTLDGLVSSNEHVAILERELQDNVHRINTGNVIPETNRDDYKWRFSETLIVDPVDPTESLGQVAADSSTIKGQSPNKSTAKPLQDKSLENKPVENKPVESASDVPTTSTATKQGTQS